MRAHKRMWIFILTVLLSLHITINVFASPNTSSDLQSSSNDLISEVNALRITNGLPPYVVSEILMRTAQGQANYMAAIGSVTHTGPGGISTTDRLLAAGYPLAGELSLGGFRAENITAGVNKTALQAVLEWQGDALHLNTMLSPNLSEIGAGVAKIGSTYYLVIDCAQPTTGGVPQAYTPVAGQPPSDAYSPGDFIVPVTINTPDANGMVYHEVQYGQSLWAIAIEYKVKIDEIRALNGLGSETDIYQGDKLLIRKDGLPVPSIEVSPDLQSPTSIIRNVPATDLPTATPVFTDIPVSATLVPIPTSEGKNAPGAFVVIGIIVFALILAGILTWFSSRNLV